MSRYALRFVALGYLLMLLIIPIGMVLYRTFQDGFGPFWEAIQEPAAMHALKLTLEVTLISVPVNTVFGIVVALMLVRTDIPGKAFWNALLALPFAVSPVIVGLGLILVYGRTTGWFGDDLAAQGIDIIFSVPGIVLATMFVSLPFVAREVMPVLREIGTEQEEAAATLGASNIADVLAGDAAGDPLGRDLWRRFSPPPGAWASTAPWRWFPERSSARPRPARYSSNALSGLRQGRCLLNVGRPGADSDRHRGSHVTHQAEEGA